MDSSTISMGTRVHPGPILKALILVALDIASWEYLLYTFLGGPVILLRHKGNIQRLLNGTESRIRLRPGRTTRDDSDSEGRP